MAKRILLVDDEPLIVKGLKFALESDGYETDSAGDGEQALEKIQNGNFDLILLDVMLPKMSGIEVCQAVREKSDVPIIMLTAKGEDMDKILGLEYGADDYMTKPFSLRELMARIKANLRRTELPLPDSDSPAEENLEIGCFTLDFNRYELYKNGQLINLTIREFDLIKYLASQPNKIFSRQKLLESVWDYEYYGDVRTVDVTVRRLREKIEDDPSDPKYIMTKRGVGYYFQA